MSPNAELRTIDRTKFSRLFQGSGSTFKHQRLMKLFPAVLHFEFAAMDLLGRLEKSALKKPNAGNNRSVYQNEEVRFALDYHSSCSDRCALGVRLVRVQRLLVQSNREQKAVRCQVLPHCIRTVGL